MTKARISDLENGKVGNPQANTVDELCEALHISREERESCYVRPRAALPPSLLENIALRFGHANPSALESDLVAFLNEQAVQFADMKKRLASMDAADGSVSKLLAAAGAALDVGDFQGADAKLAEAETAQLTSTTMPALERQHRLRFERGNAALLGGDVETAASHLEVAASYFHFLDPAVEADRRYKCSELLREHAYRFKNAIALHAAMAALLKTLEFWRSEVRPTEWCKAMNALGGVYWRLSQYDDPTKSAAHLAEAKASYAAVRDATNTKRLPYFHAIAGGNLSNIYADRAYSKDAATYASNLEIARSLLLSALDATDKAKLPTDWGIFQHNLGCVYVGLFRAQVKPNDHLDLINQAISHLNLSFEVRNDPVDIQYWIASCRSLAEALIAGATYRDEEHARRDLENADRLLADAMSKISHEEHPNQWEELYAQARIARTALRRPLDLAARSLLDWQVNLEDADERTPIGNGPHSAAPRLAAVPFETSKNSERARSVFEQLGERDREVSGSVRPKSH